MTVKGVRGREKERIRMSERKTGKERGRERQEESFNQFSSTLI
jgi:hypothetical protein